LLAGVDGGAGFDGGKFSVVSGRDVFFAGAFVVVLSSGTLAETIDSGSVVAGNEETARGTFGCGRAF
jgi:hypothetical protein